MSFIEMIPPLTILVWSAPPNTFLIVWNLFIFIFSSVLVAGFELGVDKLIFIVHFFVFLLDGFGVTINIRI